RGVAGGRVGGAALDVRNIEPSPGGDRFARLDNVLLTAHLAGLTAEAQARIASSVLSDVRRTLEGRRPRGPAILPDQGEAFPAPRGRGTPRPYRGGGSKRRRG